MSDMSASCSAPPTLQTSRPPPANKSAAAAIVHPNCPKSCSNGPVSQNCRLIQGPRVIQLHLRRVGWSGSRAAALAPGRPAPPTKLSFPAQIRRGQVLNLATRLLGSLSDSRRFLTNPNGYLLITIRLG